MILKYLQRFNLANMTTKHILMGILVALPMGNAAQNISTDIQGQGAYYYNDALQLWHNTNSAAGLTLDTVRNHGYAEFRMQHQSGDYHRVQEGAQTNRLSFYTERYQHLGKYLCGYGRFEFDNGRTKERAWSDVMRTYNSNPMISGSSVFGKYDFQNFDFSSRVGTADFNGWRFGMALDYKVGDLSRLRDPRSRSQLLDYKVGPSVAYTLGNHTVGLAGRYRRYKEKIPNMTTVQNDPSLYYYQMTGLDAFLGTVGGYKGFSREYVNHNLGAELQYGYQGKVFRSVNALSIERGAEQVLEQNKREPGRYYTYIYKVSSQNRFVAEKAIHQLDLAVDYEQGYADEYRPNLIITNDPERGYTSLRYENLFTYRKRYQLKRLDLDLHYRLNLTEGETVKNYVTVQGHLNKVSQKHLLPTSTFDLTAIDLRAEYGQALLANRRLWLVLGTGYHIASEANLKLANESTVYARSVLLKDMNYYTANYWMGKASVMYQFPVTLKGYRSLWYVKAYGETIRAQHNMERNTVGLAIGFFN